LDDAVLRRFPKRIYVGLPDAKGRQELLEILLNQQNNPLNRRDIEYVARRTDNYSNYDLTQLAKEAAMGPLREISSQDLLNTKVSQLRPIGVRDFENALTKIRPSCKAELLQTLLKFNEQYGAAT
jgi:spastin